MAAVCDSVGLAPHMPAGLPSWVRTGTLGLGWQQQPSDGQCMTLFSLLSLPSLVPVYGQGY